MLEASQYKNLLTSML